MERPSVGIRLLLSLAGDRVSLWAGNGLTATAQQSVTRPPKCPLSGKTDSKHQAREHRTRVLTAPQHATDLYEFFHSLTLSHSLPLSFTLSHSPSLSLSPSLSPSLSIPHSRHKEGDPPHATRKSTHQSGSLREPSLHCTLRESSISHPPSSAEAVIVASFHRTRSSTC